MGKRLNKEEVIIKLQKVNPNYVMVGEYKGMHEKTLFKCLICGYEWEATPDKISLGRGCPKCSKRIKGTTESFLNALIASNKHFIVLGNYINRETPVLVRCEECGYEWKVRPYDLLHKSGCPKCNKPTQDEVVSKIQKVSPTITILSTYKNYVTKLRCKCNKCNTVWGSFAWKFV